MGTRSITTPAGRWRIVNAEINSRLHDIESLLERIRDATCHDQQKERLTVLEEQMSVADFWDDRDHAEKTIAELKRVKESVQSIEDLAQL